MHGTFTSDVNAFCKSSKKKFNNNFEQINYNNIVSSLFSEVLQTTRIEVHLSNCKQLY